MPLKCHEPAHERASHAEKLKEIKLKETGTVDKNKVGHWQKYTKIMVIKGYQTKLNLKQCLYSLLDDPPLHQRKPCGPPSLHLNFRLSQTWFLTTQQHIGNSLRTEAKTSCSLKGISPSPSENLCPRVTKFEIPAYSSPTMEKTSGCCPLALFHALWKTDRLIDSNHVQTMFTMFTYPKLRKLLYQRTADKELAAPIVAFPCSP